MSAQKVFGGRYEVIGRAGSGGMAEVYRARDELLGREVALKVLSERFSRDKAFVERFRREAQAAANLSHPNIVSLYDYGSDDDTYFIVMEFIDGKALSDVIAAEAPLMPERAADIASEVAAALQRAHSAGLVHRDIKPGNIMITSAGQTKVTDFGIARALRRDGETTMTQTGMVIGTAAYLSPEQAQGNTVDARSDVYSLGCVLYEMLTGRPPFAGDTPLSIAYKHVRESAARPSQSNADVPRELDAIVLKALAKNPDNRYDSATEMQQDLQRYLGGQKVLATPLLGDETTALAGGGGTQVMRRPDTAVYPADDQRRGRGAGFWILLSLLILALFGGLAWLLLNTLLGQDGGGPRVEVPSVVGRKLGVARALLEDRGLTPEVRRTASRRAPANVVLKQDPDAGSRVAEDSTVTLTVSSGAPEVSVPSLEGQTVDEAVATLQEENLELGNQTEEANADVEAGLITSQSPAAGERVPEGSQVDVVVSSGPELTGVPDVIGATEEAARAELEGAGFAVDVFTEPNEADEGIVFAQDPGAGTELEDGATVTIAVSEGPEEQTLPDVTGEDADAAEQALEDGFGVSVSQVESDDPCSGPPGTVCAQDPAARTPVQEGDEVTLFVKPEE
jgi:beta-lactam-binding protein with PASTA domain/tRNA A-37 threonylcarbamoyl transferase component Bud32